MARRGSRQQLGTDHQHSLEPWAKEIPRVLEWVCGCSLLSPISFLGVSAIICNKREMRANDPCSAPVIHHTLPLYTLLHEIGEYQTAQNMNYCIHFTFTYFSKYFTKHLYLDNCNLFTICKRNMQQHSCGTGTGSVYHDWNQML